MTNHPTYWFPAKRYGWGWGLPSVWQGWVVMGIFAVLLLGGAFMLLPTYGSFVFVGVALACARTSKAGPASAPSYHRYLPRVARVG